VLKNNQQGGEIKIEVVKMAIMKSIGMVSMVLGAYIFLVLIEIFPVNPQYLQLLISLNLQTNAQVFGLSLIFLAIGYLLFQSGD